ncbi:MAG: quinone-dependent dihydroorotate dehydrogenase [Candidatus Obscuribacterales bacterium]|nr:quinone-dependent dihydroorotate dehydrogenase [Candidatus Obscuribacterales bacterium]
MDHALFYKQYIRPLLFKLDSESAHRLAHEAGHLAGSLFPLFANDLKYQGTDLSVNLAGTKLENPVGLAAGFDKNGLLASMLGNIGFGFAEIGSVTGKPSAGNPKPRLFRLVDDEGLINRLGLNGDGAEVVAQRLKTTNLSLPIGINIAKTNDPSIKGDLAVEDILHSFKAVKDLPAIYVTINASCPNTKEGILEEKKQLGTIFSEVQKLNLGKLPLFVKLSPDSSDELLHDMVEESIGNNLAGYVCGNTTTTRKSLRSNSQMIEQIGTGGLSGRPLKDLGLSLCRRIAKLKDANQTIIGVGGIFSGQDAFDYIAAGATVVEIYTGLIYEGPTLPKQICEELSALLKSQGMSITEAIGSEGRIKA